MAVPRLSDRELLARLVAFDTTSDRPTRPLVDFLCEFVDRPGVVIARQGIDGGAKENLVVRLGPPADPAVRAGLILSGHLDAVPAGDSGWDSDPFTLTERDGRLHARGAADMKGFLALATNLAREVDPARLAAPLVLLFTFDEEVGSLGARMLAERWPDLEEQIGPLPRAAVIGEPTSLVVVRAHKGHLKLRLTFRGRSAHSGYPHLGVNAIEAAGRAVAALSELRAELAEETVASGAEFPEVPFVALNAGTIAGGTAINVVAERCVVEVGMRTLPGVDPMALAERVRARAAAALAGGPAAELDFAVISDSPPMDTPADAPLHRHLLAALGQRESKSVAYSTDAGHLQELGLDCVIFGPGGIEVAHQPNEFVPVAELVAARGHLEGLIDAFCRDGG
ncbi:MAG TPA: acetylornithine deacetylase [Thermoanaerobaculia bacterium]|nr:acetylornithine deacetylase [Thermoanaerobaculia bacterium]